MRLHSTTARQLVLCASLLAGLVLGSLGLPRAVRAATYYVSAGDHGESSVSDGNSCGTATNINTPKRNITGGSGGLSCLSGPGDVLYIRGGTYDEQIKGGTYPAGSSYNNVSPGGSVVWIGAYTPDGANYESVLITYAGGGETLSMTAADTDHDSLSYVVWDHLHIHNGRPYYTVMGFRNGTQIFQNGEVTHTNWDAYNPDNLDTHGTPCVGDDVYPNANGILVTVSATPGYSVYPGSILRNNYFHDEKCTYAFYFQTSGDINGATIENNRFERFGWYAIQLYMNTDAQHVPLFFNDIVIRNNIFVDCGMGWNTQTLNFSNSGCITAYKMRRGLIYNNVFYNNRDGLNIKGHTESVKIYNNTFYNNAMSSSSVALFEVTDDVGNAEIRNNLSYLGPPNFLTDSSGHTGNTLFNVTQSNNSIGPNPSFVNPGGGDFHLTGGSGVAIDQGVCVSEVPTDIEGAHRPQGSSCDLGAYEFGGSPPPPALPAPTNFHIISIAP